MRISHRIKYVFLKYFHSVHDKIFKFKLKFILINGFPTDKKFKYDYKHRNYLGIVEKYTYKKCYENVISQIKFSNIK